LFDAEDHMKDRTIAFLWEEPEAARSATAGVSLHGHTLHSQECLWFLPRYLRSVPGLSWIVRRYQSGPEPAVDFSRAWWTPPLTPASALLLEQDQIARLGLRPMVSTTDHDNIEAGAALQVTADACVTPVSVEWTVPYRRSIFHLGIHNLPPGAARRLMESLAGYTANPNERLLKEILPELAANPEILVVLNHPFWLEEGVEEADHGPALEHLLREHIAWIHAFELNGTRQWPENAAVIDLARRYSRPLISGGDRHACEPAACINLTSACCFAEFVSDIRNGQSSILFMPQYKTAMAVRIFEAAWEILRPYPEYPGRERWTDRFFYRTEDGTPQPLSAVWQQQTPWVIRPVGGMIQFFGTPGVRGALRFLLSRTVAE
jgi:hypothetical protein